MSTDHTALVGKVWNYAHVLRDQGIGYGDYVEQITFLLFLKMDQERAELLGEPSTIPAAWRWVRPMGCRASRKLSKPRASSASASSATRLGEAGGPGACPNAMGPTYAGALTPTGDGVRAVAFRCSGRCPPSRAGGARA